MKFTADFETTTDELDCRVWAYALSEIGNPDNFIYGNSIDEFMEFCANPKRNYKIWFHNLKFDGSFIISWLLSNGFEYIENKKDRDAGTFTTLITDMGVYYSIEVYFRVGKKKVNKVTFYDSLKLLNFSVEQIARDFKLPIQKLELDYKEKREIGHILTPHEIDYIRNDVEIMSRALDIMFNNDLSKMTIGSNALQNYKDTLNGSFNKYFPQLPEEVDADIRTSYKGGFTYLNPLYKEKITGAGATLDVNSLYPSVMMFESLPFGEPEIFDGQYKQDLLYPLYIQSLSCCFKIKDGMIPSIQLKNNMSFMPNEYLESSDDEIVTLNLTNPDLELFFEHYDVTDITYHGGWKFKCVKGLFSNYINYWTNQKIQSKKDGNSSMYLISKLMLNSLYGKFGLNPRSVKKYPYLDTDGVVRFGFHEPEMLKPIYIPMACFITAYARRKTIETSQLIREWSKCKYNTDNYVYSDTDSIHFLSNNLEEDVKELNELFEIDDYNLGAWKLESTFKRGSYIRQKCYIEENEGGLNVTIAGMPKYLASLLNFDNFKTGFTTEGLTIEDMIEMAKRNGATPNQLAKIHHKLMYKYVKGGVILEDTGFTIK